MPSRKYAARPAGGQAARGGPATPEAGSLSLDAGRPGDVFQAGSLLGNRFVQMLVGAGGPRPERAAAMADAGTRGPGGRLPFGAQIQAAFGAHDVSDVRAHTGPEAAAAASGMGARAFAAGRDVAFAGAPDLRTSAHEAAHVVQQRDGVSLMGGVGRAGDAYEGHADAVADAVAAGRSAEALLDQAPAGSGEAVQRDADGSTPEGDLAITDVSLNKEILRHRVEQNLEVTYTRENLSSVDTPTTFSVALRYHPSPSDSGRSLGVGEMVDGMAAGAAKTVTKAVKMPIDATKGDWYVGVVIDPHPYTADPDRSNNVAFSEPLRVTDDRGNGAIDPAFGYTEEAADQARAITDDKLPYLTPYMGSDWDAEAILSQWGQVDGYTPGGVASMDTDEVRCGPTSALAAAVLKGPRTVQGVCRELGTILTERINALRGQQFTGDAEVARLQSLLSLTGASLLLTGGPVINLSLSWGTFRDLGIIAHCMKLAMTDSSQAATTGEQVMDMADLGMDVERADLTNAHFTARGPFEAALGQLAPGESYMVSVDTDRQPDRWQDEHLTGELNHWIMVGAKEGSPPDAPEVFLYDPYPRDGKQTSDIGEDSFWRYFINPPREGAPEGAFRGCMIAGKVK